MSKLSLENASHAQRLAADPSGTRLAAANAGSGKTRVLVNRVSRILLRGTPPEKILCLTYTKAAAAEMQERLFTTLGGWSVMTDDALHAALTDLFGHPPEQEVPPVRLKSARELFAKALETPEGLKVQTIHAFCERILSRFPIEAGIMPGFEPLDDREQADLRAEVEAQMLNVALADPQSLIAKGLATLTLAKADMSLEPIFNWMANSPGKIASWVEGGGVAHLADALDLGNARTDNEVAQQFLWQLNDTTLDNVAASFALGSKTDIARADHIKSAQNLTDPKARFEALSNIWFTQSGSLRKTFYNKTTDPVAQDWADKYADDAIRTKTRLRAVRIFNLTQATYDIAADFADAYATAKRKARGLDYNDQILFVRRLLNLSEASDWVRYKLDGGIEHILVDEAQDTAPEQWDIINALAAPFFEPSPDADPNNPRTLFAVGDEKQSIYGFQGAKPERFLDEIRANADRAETAKQDIKTDIRMRMSFRSAQEILDVVDSVFIECGGTQAMFDAESFAPASDKNRHVAHREDAGLVELWPIQPKPPAPDATPDPWDTTPVDALGQGHPVEVLARQIALKIKGWLDEGEPVYDRDKKHTRAMRPEDILILVRRRSDIFHAIIRHLKRCEVPIGGADRIALAEAVVVKDMLSLSRFCLLPADDLSLAEVLKSPFFGWNDDDLMAVAMDRTGTLWNAVQKDRPEIAQPLQMILDWSQTLTPFDFYTRVLDMRGADTTMRQRIYSRLSMEARDALDAFMDRALAHQTRQSPSLHHFLREIASDNSELKREPETVASEVRVMTVHGAKGLEAPVVILPDTTSQPTLRDELLEDGDSYIFKVSKSEAVPHLETAIEAAEAKQQQEQLRLLYVAMTRAESRLVVCGHWSGHPKGAGLKDGCWYEWIAKALAELDTKAFESPTDHERDGEVVTGLRYGQMPKPAQLFEDQATHMPSPLPSWIHAPAPKEPQSRRVTPSHLLANPPVEMAVRSPGSVKNRAGALRGTLIHRLLEILPDFAAARRDEVADRILNGYDDLSPELVADVKGNAFAVLEDDDFRDIFAAGSRPEVSLAGSAPGLPNGMYLNAQIDRLRVTDTDVFIVDYKSNRPPPDTVEDVSDLYIGQMAAYRELAREIYPNRTVTCALLWTDVPRMMVLPDAILDEGLRRIAALPKS